MNNQFLYDWSIYPVPLDNPNAAPFQPLTGPFEQQDRPTFYRGEFSVDDIEIRSSVWTDGEKGCLGQWLQPGALLGTRTASAPGPC